MLQADKAAQVAYQKKKGMAVYRKEAKVEKQEAQKFQRLRNESVRKKDCKCRAEGDASRSV